MKLDASLQHRKKWARLKVLTGALALYAAPTLFAEAPAPMPNTLESQPSVPALKGTLYISDDLKTALRTGPTTNHRISAFLPSGTPLSVKSSTDEWVEVDVIGTDKDGWISRLSVQSQPGAKAQLVNRDATIEKLKAELSLLRTTHDELKSLNSETHSSLGGITEQFDRLNKEYEELQSLSKDAVKNHQRMQTLHEEMASLQTKHSELEIAHELLRQDNYNRGLIHGLIAVVLGIFIAIIVPRLKSRQRSNRW